MAKSKSSAKKKIAPVLTGPKKGEKGYTKSKLIAHLAGAVSAKGLGDISKTQAASFVEELVCTLRTYASVGAPLPGLGKVLVKEIPAKPAREIMSFGKLIQVKAKPKSKKVVFRFSKEAKEFFKKG